MIRNLTIILSFMFLVGCSGGSSDAPSTVVGVAAGSYHSLALKSDGTVWAWGSNDFGQLGTNVHWIPFSIHPTPSQVKGINGEGFLGSVSALAGGYYHSLALLRNGTVLAWGRNGDGRIGDNTVEDNMQDFRVVPVQVKGPGGVGILDHVTAIAAGWNHSLAVKDDGTVWAWGENIWGQLGDNTYSNRLAPTQVSGPGGSGTLSDIVAVAAGPSHTLALRNDGTVWAWGSGQVGELGDNTATSSVSPVQVSGPGGIGFLEHVDAIAVGMSYSLALKSDGTVWGWGSSTIGMFYAPMQVVGPGGVGVLDHIVAISARDLHSMALRDDGAVFAWGMGAYGQLGNPTVSYETRVPVPVLGPGGIGVLERITAVASGGTRSLALRNDGSVWAWGYGAFGEIGDASISEVRDTPVQVLFPSP